MADPGATRSVAADPIEAPSALAPPARFSQATVAVPAGGHYRGLLSFRGVARVDGEFEGEVIADGTLWVGEAAVVRARIDVDELIVAGLLDGEVRARSRIELLSTGRVHAALRTPRLALADGCILEGRCHTGSEGDLGGPSASESP